MASPTSANEALYASCPVTDTQRDRRQRVAAKAKKDQYLAVVQVKAEFPCSCGTCYGTCFAVEGIPCAREEYIFVTAAHVLCCYKHKRIAKEIDLRTRASEHRGACTTTLLKSAPLDNSSLENGFYCVKDEFFGSLENWRRYDYGLIVIKPGNFDTNLGKKFRFLSENQPVQYHQLANVCGYPCIVRQEDTLGFAYELPWEECKSANEVPKRNSSSVFRNISDGLLRHYVDTTAGQSGGPLYIMEKNEMCAVGIHIGIFFHGEKFDEDVDCNCAVAFTTEVVKQLEKWIEGGVGTKEPEEYDPERPGLLCTSAAMDPEEAFFFSESRPDAPSHSGTEEATGPTPKKRKADGEDTHDGAKRKKYEISDSRKGATSRATPGKAVGTPPTKVAQANQQASGKSTRTARDKPPNPHCILNCPTCLALSPIPDPVGWLQISFWESHWIIGCSRRHCRTLLHYSECEEIERTTQTCTTCNAKKVRFSFGKKPVPAGCRKTTIACAICDTRVRFTNAVVLKEKFPSSQQDADTDPPLRKPAYDHSDAREELGQCGECKEGQVIIKLRKGGPLCSIGCTTYSKEKGKKNCRAIFFDSTVKSTKLHNSKCDQCKLKKVVFQRDPVPKRAEKNKAYCVGCSDDLPGGKNLGAEDWSTSQ